MRGGHVVTMAELDANPWAACGPAALAALIGRPLAEIRDVFPKGRTWMTHADMFRALGMLGFEPSHTEPSGEAHPVEANGAGVCAIRQWPKRGLAWVQFRGGWEKAGAPAAATLEHTHWVATAPNAVGGAARLGLPLVFDVNMVDHLEARHGWMPHAAWAATVVPLLAASYGLQRDKRTPKATGAIWVRAAFEVETPARALRPPLI